jgi:hypothetical protein
LLIPAITDSSFGKCARVLFAPLPKGRFCVRDRQF